MRFISFIRRYSVSPQLYQRSISNLLLNKPAGNTANVKGWITSIRKIKKFTFIDVNDGSCFEHLQLVVAKSICSPSLMSCGTSIQASGELKITPNGQLELHCQEFQVVGDYDVLNGCPILPKHEHSLNYSRQFLHHRLKTRFFTSMLRVRSEAQFAVHQFFKNKGFANIHTPILTSNDCEGAGETFEVIPANRDLLKIMKKEHIDLDKAYFNSNAYLTVSGQLHLEAVIRSLTKVYTFNPIFRAENSKSRVHLSEFYMIEAEEAFITRFEDVIKLIEELIKFVISQLISTCAEDLTHISQNNEIENSPSNLDRLEKMVNKSFSVMSFNEASSIIQKHCSDENVGKEGFTKDQELFLTSYNDNVPVFVTEWPKSMKPFYMKTIDSNPDLVHAVDLLVPIVGEVCGGSLREDNYHILAQKLKDLHLENSLDWYLDIRKYGNVPSGGFGMGFERFLQLVLNVSNIKDVIPFPRWPHNLSL